MALSVEYARKIDFLVDNIPKRIYKSVGEVEFCGFFTYDRLTLEEANT